ncbi:MAG: hypothetical protein COX19_08795 [Desulfobacterales bacterium CG23_combo_of_CG06-09_8_20_14_all_51_8]|nr:MAG: hypothetical protein COX19_08795 [Desulfobacterales bacterium CG23_combo_of_CG06-09_8_20_14_all_51_8]
MDQVKKEYGEDRTLILNAGNNFDVASHDSSLAPSYIVKALALTGTEVIAPGVSEIACGLEKLNKIVSNSSVQVISANLPGAMPYVLLSKNKGRMKVLVTSVVDPALLLKNNVTTAITVMDPVSALRHIHQHISHDLFIVVMHAGPEMISSVIEKCPDIDLVIDGMSSDFSPEQEPGTCPPVVANNNEGMYVAYIDYDGDKDQDGLNFSNPVQLKAVVGEITEDPQISALVKEYDQKRQEELRQQSATAQALSQFKASSHYVGSKSCNLCHAEINDSWVNSRHAGAMGSLVGKSRQNDPDCLSCHVTGMEKQSFPGILQVKEDNLMVGVQCEACHGPGADHSKDPQSVEMLTVNENTCTRCHTKFKDPGFNYNQDVYKVNHEHVKIGLNRHRDL